MHERGTAEPSAVGEGVRTRRLPCRYSLSIDKLFISYFLLFINHYHQLKHIFSIRYH
jgi:hypothetical protein